MGIDYILKKKLDDKNKFAITKIIENISQNKEPCQDMLDIFDYKIIGSDSMGDSIVILFTPHSNDKQYLINDPGPQTPTNFIMKMYLYTNGEVDDPLNKNNNEILLYEKLLEQYGNKSLENFLLLPYVSHIKCQLPKTFLKKIYENTIRPDINLNAFLVENLYDKLLKISRTCDHAKILFFEYVPHTITDIMYDTKCMHDPEYVKAIIFQIIYTLYILQKELSFCHEDLHLKNILITHDENYVVGKKKIYRFHLQDNSIINIPIIPYKIKIFDFDKSSYCSQLDKTHDYYNDPTISITSRDGGINDFLYFYSLLGQHLLKIKNSIVPKIGSNSKYMQFVKLAGLYQTIFTNIKKMIFDKIVTPEERTEIKKLHDPNTNLYYTILLAKKYGPKFNYEDLIMMKDYANQAIDCNNNYFPGESTRKYFDTDINCPFILADCVDIESDFLDKCDNHMKILDKTIMIRLVNELHIIIKNYKIIINRSKLQILINHANNIDINKFIVLYQQFKLQISYAIQKHYKQQNHKPHQTKSFNSY
jgi:hypothetical protein